MRLPRRLLALFACLLISAVCGALQVTEDTVVAPANAVNLIRFSGRVQEPAGRGAVSVTFSIYADSEGTQLLWSETQNVRADRQGRYSVLLGAESGGVPVELFVGESARWLGARTADGRESKTLLVSVPYALKAAFAADAETLGGRAAASFVTREELQTGQIVLASGTIVPLATSGTAGKIGKFTNTTDLGDSSMTEFSGTASCTVGSPCVGIGIDTPERTLHVKGASGALLFDAGSIASNPVLFFAHDNFASKFRNRIMADRTNESMQIWSQNGPRLTVLGDKVGINTTAPTQALDVVGEVRTSGGIRFGDGTLLTTVAAAEGLGDISSVTAGTGLSGGGAGGDVTLSADTAFLQRRVSGSCASGSSIRVIALDGTVTCETANTSAGDITSVTAGTGLTGGGTSGDVTLNIDTSVVPRLGVANTFAAQNVFSATPAGSGVAQGALYINPASASANQTLLGVAVLGTAKLRLDAEGDMALSGKLDLPQGSSGGAITLGGGNLFLHNFGTENTFAGLGAGNLILTGTRNTAAGHSALTSLTNGNDNTAVGAYALASNTGNDVFVGGGSSNTAVGSFALSQNLAPSNTAVGADAMKSNATGLKNTAVGANALEANVVGENNTAVGESALTANTGSANTALGKNALTSNLAAFGNTALGGFALEFNTSGGGNTAAGAFALGTNTEGSANTALGVQALFFNVSGESNTAVGNQALVNNTGGSNIALGRFAGSNATTGSHNIYIGNSGVAEEAATTRIGSGSQTRTFISAIRGVTTTNNDAINVVIDSAGQLGTVSSSARVKFDIAPMAAASRRVLELRPVTFRYQQPYADGSHPIQFGLIAEEVAATFPELAARNADGEIETVKYHLLPVLLLNELQRQQAELEAKDKRIAELEERLARIEAALAEKP